MLWGCRVNTTENNVEVIVFDLGGVLIDWNPRYLFRKLFAGDDARMEYFLTSVCHQGWNEKQDAGRPFAQAVAELCVEHPEWQPFIRAYFDRWPEMLGGAIDGTVAVLKRLKADGFPVYALTNWSAETFPFARQRFEFLQWFDGIVVSGEENMKKPDARFFQILLDRHQIDAPKSLFIDDVWHNIEGAAAVGMQTHHFQNPAVLTDDLRRRGLW